MRAAMPEISLFCVVGALLELELELELIQPHMAQKPVLRGEVGCACVAREVSVEGVQAAPGSTDRSKSQQLRALCFPLSRYRLKEKLC